jgi:hypothetical protein
MSDTFTCSRCGQTFRKEWSDEEAKAESEKQWGLPVADGTHSMICDDCYREFMQWLNGREPC